MAQVATLGAGLLAVGLTATAQLAVADEPCDFDAGRFSRAVRVERVGALPPVPLDVVFALGDCVEGELTVRVRFPDGRESVRIVSLEGMHADVRERLVATLLVELAQRTMLDSTEPQGPLSEAAPAMAQGVSSGAGSSALAQPATEEPRSPSLDRPNPLSESPRDVAGDGHAHVSATLQAGVLTFLRGPTAVPVSRLVFGVSFIRFGVDFAFWEHPHALGRIMSLLWTGRLGARLYTWGEAVRLGVDIQGILGGAAVAGIPNANAVRIGVIADDGSEFVGGGSVVVLVTHAVGALVIGTRLEVGWLVGIEAIDGPVIDGPFVDLSLVFGLASEEG